MRRFFRKIYSFPARIGRFLWLFADDLLVISGVSVVVATNFRVNQLLGWYSLGAALLLAGVLIARLGRGSRS